MFLIVFLAKFINGILLFGFVPESAALLAFGVGLVGVTAVVRRFLKSGEKENDSEEWR